MRFFVLIIILACLFLLGGCFKELPLEQVQECEFASDCIQVYSAGCCKCPMTINKEYSDYWDKLEKKKSDKICLTEVCTCGPKSLGTDCVNNTCTLMYSPVGMSVP